MAPKNKKRNGFYFFMKEMQQREAAKGYNISMKNLPDIAHPLWTQLSLKEREPYEELARQRRNDPNLRGAKLASDGTRVEDNLREIEEEERRINQMKQDVKRFCNANCLSEDAFKEVMPKKLIHFLSFNILCHTDEDVYIPIEVGLVEYSIEHGIMTEYHKLLNPGGIPHGYTGIAKRLSEDKHQIDIFSSKDRERNMRTVYRDIKKFTSSSDCDDFIPVFCLDTDVEMVMGCLDWLSRCTGEENFFVVWNAAYLLMEMRAGVGHPFPSYTSACDLLHKNSFDFHPCARCYYHEDIDVSYCAMAYSKRLCYLFSDAVCHLFDIELTPKHIPARSVEDKDYVISSTADSDRFSRSRSSITYNEHLDQRNAYYENDEGEDEEEEQNIVSLIPPLRPVEPVQNTFAAAPRQPASSCLAEEMARLGLKNTIATVPGHGIGRGQRR
ncbi:protein maelstrom homolog [Stegodyphus dumicola]|uniref:protein maelstrom homolog n=1 Tax=Stegodyphus dumicola TaxID=202533 RepID=UPI0015B125F8|nr:protein maelstrom homolog [Stegodyphus dumicola]